MEALQRIPIFSREKVRQIIDFYTPFVNFLVSMGLANHQRAEAEKALRESEEKFARTFRFTPSALSISTVAEGRYVEVNDTFEQSLGYARGEVVGRNALELGIWESPETLNQMVQAVLEKGEVRGVEGRLRSKNGKTLVGLLSAEIIEIKEELCLLTLVNDITERKRLEGEIEILNTELTARAFELETANRELESFNYTVSHDLRRHITVISGYSNLLMELFSATLSEQALSYLKEVELSTQKMEQLIETLMSFALLSRSEMTRTTVDLTEMAQRINWSLRLSDAGRKVSCTVAEALSANGDAKLLEIVLENLLGNAWKYSSKRETAEIEFGSTSIEGETVFFVRDNGEGFDMADAEKLFSPFERLPGTRDIPGHGIGLATVQRIIQRHGGQVWAHSEPGKGATFYFKL
jgi:PAS domain S-box-containing protein